FDSVKRLGAFDFERVPPLLVNADILAVDSRGGVWSLEINDLTRCRFSVQLAAETRRNIDAVVAIAGLTGQGSSQRDDRNVLSSSGSGSHRAHGDQSTDHRTAKPVANTHAASRYGCRVF